MRTERHLNGSPKSQNTAQPEKTPFQDCSFTPGPWRVANVVLEVGTDNSDDYYPSFVANFQPENMATNASASEPPHV